MTISTLDQWIAAAKQKVGILKTTSRTAIAAQPYSVFDLAGNPGFGVLAGTDTVSGVIQNNTNPGYPDIRSFGSGATGYLGSVTFSNTVASRLTLFDCLWKAGAYPYNANVTLSGQPSYAGRIPAGSNYVGTEIWLEAVTTFTGLLTIAVTYTNEFGSTGRTTGSVATGVGPPIGRMINLPLQRGDAGVQKIESVVCSVATAGTFNLLVMRRLWQGRVRSANDGDSHDFLKTGMPEVFANSALFLQVDPDSAATGIPEVQLDIVNG